MGDFMKTLQKYTNIALFLISATMIIPAYANQTDITKSQKAETVWYKRPEVCETAKSILEVAFVIATLTCMHIVFRGYAKAKTDGIRRDRANGIL
jgi:hypothetical protein